MNLETLYRAIRPLKTKVQMMIGRCVLQAVNDEKKMQLVKISGYANEVLEDIERFQDYGFTSNPLPGAEACAVFVGGKREHGIVVKIDDRRYRFKGMESGEVAIYTDEEDFIHFKRTNEIEINSKKKLVANVTEDVEVNTKRVVVNAYESAEVNTVQATVNATGQTDINTPTCNISDDCNIGGDLQVTGLIDAQLDIRTFVAAAGGTSIAQLRSIYNTHDHNQGNDSDGNSQQTTNDPNQQVP